MRILLQKPWKCLALTCPATYLKAKKARYHLKHSQILLKCAPVILPTLISLWYSIAYLWLWLTDCFASTGSSHVPLNIIYCLCLLLEQVCSLSVRVLGQIAGASLRWAEGADCLPAAHFGKSTHSQASYEYHRYLWAPFLWLFSHWWSDLSLNLDWCRKCRKDDQQQPTRTIII